MLWNDQDGAVSVVLLLDRNRDPLWSGTILFLIKRTRNDWPALTEQAKAAIKWWPFFLIWLPHWLSYVLGGKWVSWPGQTWLVVAQSGNSVCLSLSLSLCVCLALTVTTKWLGSVEALLWSSAETVSWSDPLDTVYCRWETINWTFAPSTDHRLSVVLSQGAAHAHCDTL